MILVYVLTPLKISSHSYPIPPVPALLRTLLEEKPALFASLLEVGHLLCRCHFFCFLVRFVLFLAVSMILVFTSLGVSMILFVLFLAVSTILVLMNLAVYKILIVVVFLLTFF